MNRRVERHYIDKWVNEKYPDAITKLAIASGIPASSIAKIRLGRVPKSQDDRQRLSKALSLKEDVLFPPVEDEAS